MAPYLRTDFDFLDQRLKIVAGVRGEKTKVHAEGPLTDPKISVNEWSVGPSSAAHAGGWDEKTLRPEHRFLRTGQGGFFSGVITPTATGASLELRLHDVDGRVVYRELK